MDKTLQVIQAETQVKGGKMIAIASSEAVDRVGDSLKLSDWDLVNFKKNPVLQAGHDYNPQFTIGIAEDIRVEGGQLIFSPKFHEITQLARDIKKMYEEGFLKAWSVGFKPGSGKGSKNELLEVSAVAVPANPEALMLSMKSAKELGETTIVQVKEWIEENSKEEVMKPEPDAEQPIPAEESTEKDTSAATPPEKKPKTPKQKQLSNELVKEHFGLLRSDIEEALSTHEAHLLDEEVNNDEEDGSVMTDETLMYPKRKPKKKKSFEYFDKFENAKKMFKSFDVASAPSTTTDAAYTLITKFLEVKVKDVYNNTFSIPMPLLGTYLSAVKHVLAGFELKDTRAYSWNGEVPPSYQVIQLNSEKSDDFLVNGIQFLTKGTKNLVVETYPTWFGMNITINSSVDEKKWNNDILGDIKTWVDENNYLKNERFSLSGEFLAKTADQWDDLILEADVKKNLARTVKNLNEKGVDSISRGVLMYGAPGNGKTKSGRIMMNESENTFIWVSAKDLRAVEGGIGLAFELAQKLAPSIIFFEDIDGWLSKGTCDIMKGEMDGLKQVKGVVTILTSNDPNNLPDALLDRPGRFHDIVKYECPNNIIRKEMMRQWLKGVSSETIDMVVEETEGFSGAHMKELADFAMAIATDEAMVLDEAVKKSLEKLRQQKVLVQEIRDSAEKKGFDGMVEKVGAVLSKKNKTIIGNCITAINQTKDALEKLLEENQVTATSEDEAAKADKSKEQPAQEKSASPKGRTGQKKNVSSEDIAFNALKRIAGQASYELNRLNQKS
jgi:hypothetical protein